METRRSIRSKEVIFSFFLIFKTGISQFSGRVLWFLRFLTWIFCLFSLYYSTMFIDDLSSVFLGLFFRTLRFTDVICCTRVSSRNTTWLCGARQRTGRISAAKRRMTFGMGKGLLLNFYWLFIVVLPREERNPPTFPTRGHPKMTSTRGREEGVGKGWRPNIGGRGSNSKVRDQFGPVADR